MRQKNSVSYLSLAGEDIFELEESPAAGNLLIYVDGNLTYNHAVLKGASLLVYDYDVGIYAKKGKYRIEVKFNTTDGKIVKVEDYDLDYDVDGLSDDFDSSYYYTSSYAPLTNQSDMVFRLLSSPMSGTLVAFVNGTKVYETAVSKGWPEFIHVSDLNITKAGLYYVEVNFTGANGKEYLLQAFDLYYNPDTFVLINDMVDVSYPDAYVAYINDPDLLNGTVTLYIDGEEYFKKTFNATQAGARIYFADLNLSDEFTGNHTVKVTYNDLSSQTQVSFKYVPYFIQPYDVAIGDTSFIIFKGGAGFNGTVRLYNAVYNNETRTYDVTTLIGTYPISDANSLVPIPILTEGGYHVFCANYTVDGDNYSELFRVWVFENSPEFTLSISATRINVTDSVTVKVTGPAVGSIDFYINGEWDRTFSLANGTVEYVMSNFTEGRYLISAMFSGSIDYSYSSSLPLSVGLDAVTGNGTDSGNQSGTEPGNATGNGTDSGNSTGTNPDGNSTTVTVDITNAAVTLSAKSFTFNSKVQKPLIKSIGGETLVEGIDYLVVWSNP